MSSELLYRAITIDKPGVKSESREVELSFASEQPVERQDWDTGKSYLEVLDHSPSSVDFSRLNNGGALLRDHDRTIQPGVIVKGTARVDSDKKSRARVKFSRSKVGEEEYQDCLDGIRTLVSTGYKTGREISRQEVEGVETRRFEWTPYEVSTVSIPADTSVGVARGSNHSAPIQMTPTNTADDSRKAEIVATAEYMTKTFPRGKSQIDQAAAAAVLSGTEAAIFKRSLLDKIDSFKEPSFENNAAPDFTNPQAGLSDGNDIGSQFSRSRTYQAIANVRGSKRHAVTEVAFSRALNTRATGTTSAFTSIDKVPGVVLLGQQPLTVADLLTEVPTMATTVRFMLERSFTNAATAVAENGQKPEASWDLVETDSIVRKIAVVSRVTDEMFQDYAQMRAYINDRLAFMVAQKEDNYLLNGLGNSNQILGLLQTPLIQTQAQGAATAPDAIHKAMTKIRTGAFLEPDGIVLNPLDWENIRLMKDENGQYYGTGPLGNTYGQAFATAAPVLWQKPVVLTTAIAQGTVLVGAFKNAAAIYRKLGLTIETTNSDESDFQYNRIAVRAETRLTLCCYRPLAFCTVTGLS